MATAPKLEAISALAPGKFGGNMDVPDTKPEISFTYLSITKEDYSILEMFMLLKEKESFVVLR